ncbi:MAG: pyridoxamine 5'-phosphate oxidase family protein [Anaerolineaceae bacterium]|nr:pyridoxamine 5'-phosphate oxidase family protein [Anaerolineaceae bacterium]
MNIDHPEVQMFFRQAMVARISTVSCSGRPSITPLYFNYVNGKIWLGTSTWTLAAREVSNDSHVCILLQYEKQKSDPRILRIMGTATIRTDDAALRLRDRKMALKYVLSPGGLLNHALHLHLFTLVRKYRAQSDEKGPGCVIEVTPQHIEFI